MSNSQDDRSGPHTPNGPPQRHYVTQRYKLIDLYDARIITADGKQIHVDVRDVQIDHAPAPVTEGTPRTGVTRRWINAVACFSTRSFIRRILRLIVRSLAND